MRPPCEGSLYEKYAELAVGDTHLERWVSLFGKTVDARNARPRATDAKGGAEIPGITFANMLKWQLVQA